MSLRSVKVYFLLISIFLSLVAASLLAELCLHFMDRRDRQGILDYETTTNHQEMHSGGFLRPNFKARVTDGSGGEVRWANNSLGFRNDEEFAAQPPPGVLRVLSLGDSFTAGYRVDQTETFSYLLESWARQNFGKIEVLVSEIKDLSEGLYYFDRFGIKLHPQILLLGITVGNDLTESYISLQPQGNYVLSFADGHIRIDRNPAFDHLTASKICESAIPEEYLTQRSPGEKFLVNMERWLRRSQLMRRLHPQGNPIVSAERDPESPKLLDIVNGLAVFAKPLPPLIEEAYHKTFLLLKGFQDLCESRRIKLVVQIFPQRYQVQPGDWKKAVREYRLNESFFDLMTPNRRIQKFCRENNILFIDPTETMSQRYLATQKSLYLPRGDMHWNREGHRAFFEAGRKDYAAVLHQGFQSLTEIKP